MKFHYWNFFHNSRKRIMFSFILIIRKYAIVDALMAHYPQIERARYILIVNRDRSRTSEIEPKSSHSRVRFSLHRAWDRSGSLGEPAFRVVFVTRNSLRGHNDINYDWEHFKLELAVCTQHECSNYANPNRVATQILYIIARSLLPIFNFAFFSRPFIPHIMHPHCQFHRYPWNVLNHRESSTVKSIYTASHIVRHSRDPNGFQTSQ